MRLAVDQLCIFMTILVSTGVMAPISVVEDTMFRAQLGIQSTLTQLEEVTGSSQHLRHHLRAHVREVLQACIITEVKPLDLVDMILVNDHDAQAGHSSGWTVRKNVPRGEKGCLSEASCY